MDNKIISIIKISTIISLCIISSNLSAAYFSKLTIPDYDIVTTPSHHTYHHASKHHHSAKRNTYSLDKYYVYNTPNGDLVWVPAPCDCSGTWVKVRHTKSNASFSHEPEANSGYIAANNDELDPNFDTSTSDDVE